MLENPKLSIITPVYNCKKHIENCIQSVIKQNCPNLEHLIIDGGSTDGTISVIENYAQKYPHIRWTSEKDKGQSDAMNKGIALARGKLIGVINADDYYEPNILNEIINQLDQLPEPTLLIGNCKVLNDKGELIELNEPKKLSLVHLLLDWNLNTFPLNPSAYFYHKSIHDLIGMYDVDEHYAMDLDFLLKAYRKANLKYIDKVFGHYRFLTGTKTFVAVSNKQSSVNQRRVKEKFLKSLPRFLYWQIMIQKYILTRWVYYQSRPEKLGQSVLNKIKRKVVNPA